MQNIDLIIFDCDGTLVDSEPISNQVVADMMNQLNIPMTKERSIELFAGKKFADIVHYIEANIDYPLDFNFESEFRVQSKIAFEKYLKPIPGVIDFIESLDIRYCVASNGPRIKMETTLSVTGLDKYFTDENTFSAYDINKWKPDPALFLHAASSLNSKPASSLVIEDTISGATAAINANMKCIIYSTDKESEIFNSMGLTTFSDFLSIDLNAVVEAT